MPGKDPYTPGSLEGVPAEARTRLEQNRQGLFTSDLSVNEFLLIRDAGFEPLGLVVGSSIYHVGYQFSGLRTGCELDVLSQAMYHSRELAMTRLEEEADALGADGVVGVRLEVGSHSWGKDLIEFIAVGTAVRHREGEMHRTADGRPFTSDLSGQAFWTLLRTGHRPVGLVMGSCVYHVGMRGVTQVVSNAGRNLEMGNITQALYSARELAMTRMQTEAAELGAVGIVEVSLREGHHGWGDNVIEFFAVGTAIVPSDGGQPFEPPSPVLDLNG